MTIINCKDISNNLDEYILKQVQNLNLKGIMPTLATVIVGENPASLIYVNNKIKKAKLLGIENIVYSLKQDTTESKLIKLIEELNNNTNIHGILIQLPLPEHIDYKKILLSIDPKKDVDGLHPLNNGLLSLEKNNGYIKHQDKYKGFVPCTPMGCIEILKSANIEMKSKIAVVVGRSQLVGNPMVQLLNNNDCTVILAHSKTDNLKSITNLADILILAIGKPNFIDDTYVKSGSCIIDVGISKVDGIIHGDANISSLQNKVANITPVPKGVGLLTVSCLMYNVVKATVNFYNK